MEFAELKQEVVDAGLYERRYTAYFLCATFVALGLAAGFYLLTVSDNLILQIFNACFLALMTVQAGMLGHDFSHSQVFKSRSKNRFFALIMWSLLGGLSESRWYEKHNAHHEHVNHDGLDPDLETPFVFSSGQEISTQNGLAKYLRRNQHIWFFILLPFLYPNLILQSFKRMLKIESPIVFIELLLVVAHYLFLIYMVFAFLPLMAAIIFMVVYGLVTGYVMGTVFAPNHKGMEVVESKDRATWVEQIILTRNLRPSFLGFHFFGGLNYQIEHHLFPNMPRYNYPKTRHIVKEFCRKHEIPYHETTWFGSVKEIYYSLKENRGQG